MTLEIEPETAQKLLTLARGKGVSVDELLRKSVPGLSPLEPPMSDGDERAKAFRNWAANHSTDTPLLSSEAISRRGIYER